MQLALGSAGVPETFVIDGKGVIRRQYVGPIGPTDVPKIIAELEEAAVRAIALALASCWPRRSSRQSNMPPSYWAYRQLPDAKQEAKAQALMQELRCLVCQGQSIADSDAELAGDMRDLVRRRIAAGEKPEHIRAWLIERYGDWVSYRPSAAADCLAACGPRRSSC